LTSVMTTSPRNMLCVIKEVEFNYGMLHWELAGKWPIKCNISSTCFCKHLYFIP
jgi:hypothetical protein